jgi:hypothetical protein
MLNSWKSELIMSPSILGHPAVVRGEQLQCYYLYFQVAVADVANPTAVHNQNLL